MGQAMMTGKGKKNSTTVGAILVLVVFALWCCFGAGNAYATEGGGGAYPNGAEDFMSGAVPPPGTYFLNYFTYYHSDRFNDKNGDSSIPDFNLNVVANTFRLLHVTKTQIFGGNWGMHVFVPLVNVNLEVPGAKGHEFNVGEIIVDPFILSWHSKNWHFATGVDVYIPTQHFTKTDLVNVTRNYWTFEPIFAFTYLSDSGIEVSTKFMYDFNTKNDDTDYLSGQEFHFDYTLGYHIKNWSLGVGGYYYYQTTNDELNGVKVGPDGFKGRLFAVGPQVKYDYKNMSFILKWQAEVEAKNKPEGNKLWFKFVYAF